MTVVWYGLQASSGSVQAQANISFGVEFDDDVICAVDKLERDYVLKEVNSCDAVTETAQDVRSRRKTKTSRTRVGAKLDSSRRKTHEGDVDSKCIKSKPDAMSLTVIKGHTNENTVFSTREEANDQDVACSWNSPLLVSTPVGLNRRATNKNIASDAAATAVAGCEMSVTPSRVSSSRKSKTKKAEKTKLFEVKRNNNSLNAIFHTEAECLQNGHKSPRRSSMQDSHSDGRQTCDAYITPQADGKFLLVLM